MLHCKVMEDMKFLLKGIGTYGVIEIIVGGESEMIGSDGCVVVPVGVVTDCVEVPVVAGTTGEAGAV